MVTCSGAQHHNIRIRSALVYVQATRFACKMDAWGITCGLRSMHDIYVAVIFSQNEIGTSTKWW